MNRDLRNDDKKMTFRDHIRSLRRMVFSIVGIVLLAAGVIHYYREPVQKFLVAPLGDEAPPLQFLDPLDPLFFILKIDFTLGFLLSLPLIVYFIWRFISPAIEVKNPFTPFLIIISSAFLGTLAAFYTYSVLTPIILDFMSGLVMQGTEISFTADGYYSFLLSTSVLLILVFQIPIAVVGLTRAGILSTRDITKNRPYIYSGIFVLTAFITPTTDIITLFLVALPAIIVVELGVLISKILDGWESDRFLALSAGPIALLLIFGLGYFSYGYEFTVYSKTLQNQFAAVATYAGIPTPAHNFSSLSLDEKIAQLFIVGYSEKQKLDLLEMLNKYPVGGVIIMDTIATSTEGIRKNIHEWQKVSETPLIVAIDQEGGVVTRLQGTEFTQTAQSDIVDSREAYQLGLQRGSELASVGINMNLAPVLDISTSSNAFLFDRAFRSQEHATMHATALMVGMKESGVLSVPKHFPGHEDTPTDSHVELPVLAVTADDFDKYVEQFTNTLELAEPSALMTAHVLVKEVDPVYPATLSSTILTDHLRKKQSFDGVIMTDDIHMGAITQSYEAGEAAVLALLAGADMILVASRPDELPKLVTAVKSAVESGRILESKLDESLARIGALKAGL